jgi:DNA-binding transcriptional LysR family regulator
MLSPEQVAALAAGELDFGLLLPPVAEAARSSTWWCSVSVRRRAAGSPPPRGGRGALAMGDLAGESFVMVPREIAPGLYDIVSGLASRAGFSLNVAQEAIQMQTVVSLVSSGWASRSCPRL